MSNNQILKTENVMYLKKTVRAHFCVALMNPVKAYSLTIGGLNSTPPKILNFLVI